MNGPKPLKGLSLIRKYPTFGSLESACLPCPPLIRGSGSSGGAGDQDQVWTSPGGSKNLFHQVNCPFC